MICLPCKLPCFPRPSHRQLVSSASAVTQAFPQAAVSLEVGARVQIKGLKMREEFNGRFALVTGRDASLNRWDCKVLNGENTGKYVKLKAENLTVLSTSLAELLEEASSAEAPAWVDEGIPRQLRVAPGMKVPVCASPGGEELFVIEKPGSPLLTTGRREGKWIERATLFGQSGWVSSQTSSGETMLLPDPNFGRHGDDSESKIYHKLVLQGHGKALLDLHLAPNAAAPEQDPLSIEELSPKTFQIRQGRHNAHLITPHDSKLEKRPLLVVLHGGSKGRAYQFSDVVSRFAEAASENGIFVLLPEALDHTWDFITTGQRADMDWLGLVLDEVRRRYPVDEKHIAVMGLSDGASMALSLGINNPTIFNAIMAQSAGFYHDGGIGQRDNLPKPRIFLEHGLRDEVFRFTLCLDLWDRLRYQEYIVEFRAHAKFPEYSHIGNSNPVEAIKYWLSLPPPGPLNAKLVYDEVWSLKHVVALGSNDHKAAGVIQVLDENLCTSLEQAVQALDAGSLNSERNFCIVCPAQSSEQFLVYRSDTKRDALQALLRSDKRVIQNTSR
mmetsp:Transcript_158734/g.280399  ORF Transcript_158734/g.280399 Transcript_158734/m.280399 type:complete len:556 (+) Transcript_158734:58-1725(+)